MAVAARRAVQAPSGPPPSAIGHFLQAAGQYGQQHIGGGAPRGYAAGGGPAGYYEQQPYAAQPAGYYPEPYDPQHGYGSAEYGGEAGGHAGGSYAGADVYGGGYDASYQQHPSAPAHGSGHYGGFGSAVAPSGGYAQQARPAPGRAAPALDIEDIFSKIRHNRLDDVAELLKSGVPLNLRDRFGNTMLAIACQNGLKRMSKLLLRQGADINASNYKGNTPLMFCYTYGYGETLGQYLMSKGADSTMVNKENLSCFEVDSQFSSK
jgi:hypothetical protein